MTTTPPPPPGRLHTPPTPLHGPKYDSYEPYSPRRSSRISSKRGNHSFQENMGPSDEHVSRPRPAKAPQRKATFKRTSSQTFSPPSSPMSPHVSTSPRTSRNTANHHQNGMQRQRLSHSDQDPTRILHPPISQQAYGMPTPSKTPKKRGLYDDSQIQSAARVLFPSRAVNNDDHMPSPRKSRKSKHAAFTLLGEEEAAEEVHIFTDSKERIPEVDEAEDNPFLSRRTTRTSRRSPQSLHANGTKHGLTKEIDEAVERGEGMVYVFRGKKFFRKFSEEAGFAHDADELGMNDDAALVRSAGPESRKRLSRKDIKPRLLFPPRVEEEDLMHDDEEALTDIDPEPQTHHQHGAVTPTKATSFLSTPPSTVKKQRVQDDLDREEESRMWLDGANDRMDAKSRKSKMTPFDMWQRTKPGVGKRSLDAVDKAANAEVGEVGMGKRARSGH